MGNQIFHDQYELGFSEIKDFVIEKLYWSFKNKTEIVKGIEEIYFKIAILMFLIFLVLNSNMQFYSAFSIGNEWTKFAAKWLFSSVNHDMSLDFWPCCHNLRTVWTSPFTTSNSNCIILEKGWFLILLNSTF